MGFDQIWCQRSLFGVGLEHGTAAFGWGASLTLVLVKKSVTLIFKTRNKAVTFYCFRSSFTVTCLGIAGPLLELQELQELLAIMGNARNPRNLGHARNLGNLGNLDNLGNALNAVNQRGSS